MKRTEHREFFQHLLQDYKDLFTDAVPNGPQIDPETTIRHNNSKITGRNPTSQTMWLSNGEQMNYKMYPNPARPKRTIKDELGSMSYGSYFPSPPSEIESLKFSPLPAFKNEFADWKLQPKNVPLRVPMRPSPTTRHPPGYKPYDMPKHCSFCKKNGELAEMYMSHQLFDQKLISCPVLATCVCPQCGKTGHTISYCPRPPAETQTSIVRLLSEHNKPNPSGAPPSMQF